MCICVGLNSRSPSHVQDYRHFITIPLFLEKAPLEELEHFFALLDSFPVIKIDSVSRTFHPVFPARVALVDSYPPKSDIAAGYRRFLPVIFEETGVGFGKQRQHFVFTFQGAASCLHLIRICHGNVRKFYERFNYSYWEPPGLLSHTRTGCRSLDNCSDASVFRFYAHCDAFSCRIAFPHGSGGSRES